MNNNYKKFIPNNVKRVGKKLLEKYINPTKVEGKTKIFCIGRNKTGTTSLKRAFEDLGLITGNQRSAEELLPHYKNKKFEKIIEYCHTAQVFQDFPFSYPETYKYIDKAYPNSKFILTERDSPEQWYNSLVKFHAKSFGKGKVPMKEDLQNAPYVWKGWMWECNRIIYKTPEKDVYNKEIMIKTYEKHNNEIKEYFKNRLDDLIVINISQKGDYQKLMNFLNINSPYSDFPWENKTSNKKIYKIK